MPFLGILEDRKLQTVPGTVILEEDAANLQSVTGALRHGTGHSANIVLVPQPSNDPNDPLNWTYTKKLRALSVTISGSILYSAVMTSMLNPAFGTIAKDLHVPVAKVVVLSGYFSCAVGVTGPIMCAIAHKYGKRPLFLFAGVMAVIANIVGATSKTYPQFVACRVLQGFAVAPFESLVYALVSDLFFAHERGLYTAIVNFVVVAVSNLTAAVSGPIANTLGWKYTVYFLLLLAGLHTIVQFFLVPETSYVRDSRFETDQGADKSLQELVALKDQQRLNMEKDVTASVTATSHYEDLQTPFPESIPKKKTFRQNIAIYNGRLSDESLFQLYIAPYAILSNAAVACVVIIVSIYLTLFIVIALVLPVEFAAKPYSFNSATIGRLSYGPFAGGTIATLFIALLSDRLIKWCARRNKGIYEPEYRLLPALVGMITGAALMGWGVAVSRGLSPYLTATLHGIMIFGVIFMSTTLSTYVMDSFRHMTAEIFIAIQTSKNFLVFGFSYFITDWTAHVGVKHAFFVWGGLALALSAGVPVMFFFGKKYRSFWARHDMLKKWHIITHSE